MKQFKRTIRDLKLNIDIEYIQKLYNAGNKVYLDTLNYKQLYNTQYDLVKNRNDAIRIASKYHKDYQKIADQFNTQRVYCPIIMDLGNDKYYCIAGNTRLIVAKALNIIPMVLVFKYKQE